MLYAVRTAQLECECTDWPKERSLTAVRAADGEGLVHKEGSRSQKLNDQVNFRSEQDIHHLTYNLIYPFIRYFNDEWQPRDKARDQTVQ